jgi:hypothetical protein
MTAAAKEVRDAFRIARHNIKGLSRSRVTSQKPRDAPKSRIVAKQPSTWADSFPAHRLNHPSFIEDLAVIGGGVLAAAIGMGG